MVVEALASLPELRVVRLNGTLVDGVGLLMLAGHPSIERIEVVSTAVDQIAIAQYQQAGGSAEVVLEMPNGLVM